MEHPFDAEENFVSKFPLGFRGCFNCGATDHFCSNECPAVRAGISSEKNFFLELHSHKPWLKKHRNNSSRIPSDTTPSAPINAVHNFTPDFTNSSSSSSLKWVPSTRAAPLSSLDRYTNPKYLPSTQYNNNHTPTANEMNNQY